MPQPLKNYVELSFDPGAITARPELAIYIARITARSTIIDALMTSFLMGTLQTKADIAVEIYNAIENDGAKAAVLRALAAKSLPKSEMQGFSDLLTEAGKRAKERNRVVHAIWGISAAHPTGLIWLNPKDLLSIATTSALGSKTMPVLIPNPPEGSAFVYEKHDFEEIETRLIELAAQVIRYWRQIAG